MGLTARFFYLHLLDRERAGVARGTDDPRRDETLVEPGVVDDWTLLELELQGGGHLTDYLANDVGVRLCSVRLRDLIDQNRSPSDEVQWLDAQVVDASGEARPYFVLHLVSHPDVLHPQRTITARGDFVVKAVLDGSRVGGHSVFSFPGSTTRLILSEAVRNAIMDAACTGVDFSEVAVA